MVLGTATDPASGGGGGGAGGDGGGFGGVWATATRAVSSGAARATAASSRAADGDHRSLGCLVLWDAMVAQLVWLWVVG